MMSLFSNEMISLLGINFSVSLEPATYLNCNFFPSFKNATGSILLCMALTPIWLESSILTHIQ